MVSIVPFAEGITKHVENPLRLSATTDCPLRLPVNVVCSSPDFDSLPCVAKGLDEADGKSNLCPCRTTHMRPRLACPIGQARRFEW